MSRERVKREDVSGGGIDFVPYRRVYADFVHKIIPPPPLDSSLFTLSRTLSLSTARPRVGQRLHFVL